MQTRLAQLRVFHHRISQSVSYVGICGRRSRPAGWIISRETREVKGAIVLAVKTVGFAVALSMGLAAADSVAQGDSKVRALAPGAKVRFELPLPSVGQSVGTASEANAAGFRFQPVKGGESQQVQFTDLRSLQVSTGTKRHWGAGFLFGFIGGAILGQFVSVGGDELDMRARVQMATIVGFVGSLPGTLIGGLVKTDRWATIPLH